MHRLFILSLSGLLLFPMFLSSQSNKVDSLKNILADQPTDTTRLRSLNALSWQLYLLGDYEESKNNAREAILFADSVHHPTPHWAIQRKAMAHSILGIIHCSQGDYEEALEHHTQSLYLGQASGNENGVADDYTNLGIVSWYMSDYPKAIEYYYSALKIYEKSGDKDGIGNIHNNIGGVYEYMQQYDDALTNYQKSLEIRKSLGHKEGIAGAYNNVGNIYDYQGKYPESLDNHFMALEIYEEISYPKGIAEVMDNIANTYSNMKEYAKELEYRNKSLHIKENLGDQLGIGTSYFNIANTYVDQKKYREAINFIDKGMLIFKEIGARDMVMDSYALLAEAYSGLKEYKKAYDFHQEYSNVRDTLRNETNSQQITEIKEKYEVDKKDSEIALLHKDHDLLIESQRRKAQARHMILLGCVILSLFAFVRYQDLQTLRIEKMRNKISKDLHDDIGSTLSSISISSAVAARMKPEEYSEMISTLTYIGDSTRSAMENMSDIVWAINPSNDSLKNLVERLRIYAYKILEAKNIELLIDIPESMYTTKLTMNQCKNIYLICREAIQNVAKYSGARTCIVTGQIVNGKFNLEIKDDGIGFNEVKMSLGGNGLVNMKQRAEELNATFYVHSEKEKGSRLSLQFKEKWYRLFFPFSYS